MKRAGTGEFDEKLKNFVEKFGIPDDDWGSLLLFLDSGDPELVGRALKAVEPLIESKSLTEKNALRSKLRILSLSAGNRSVAALAAEMLQKL